MFAFFPVSTANNSYVDFKKYDRFDSPYLYAEKLIAVTDEEGKLEIITPD
ncbi:hypothetical protein [Bacillus sp. AFS031507]|nr:hypothetical protein [Bacillus sp. AFS031507]